MKKNLMFVCIALIVVMSLIVSCDNSSKNPDAGKFTVTFDTDGGSVIKPVKIGLFQTVAEPEKPTKEDYAFDGWYLGNEKYDFSKPVISNITLVAKWNLIFEASTDLLDDITSTITGTFEAYDILPARTFKVEDVNVSDFKYYVYIGTTPLDSIENIKLGNSTFTKDQEVSISMGNNAFIKDKVFYVEDNKLYIAAPILAIELTANENFYINGIKCGLNCIPITQQVDIINAAWISGSNNSATIDNNSCTLTIKDTNADKYVMFSYGKGASLYLTKKTYKNDAGVITKFNYGFTAPESTGELGFYPLGYSDSGIPSIDYSNIDYYVYFMGSDNNHYHNTVNLKIVIVPPSQQ